MSHCVCRLCYNHGEVTATNLQGFSETQVTDKADMSRTSSLVTYETP